MSETYCYPHPRPAVTVDVACVAAEGGRLKILLIERNNPPFAGAWALPGGFVDHMEPLEKAAARELREETGLENVAIELVGAYGDPGRDPRGHTVSIAYLARLASCVKAEASDDAAAAEWFFVDELPELAFDHARIVAAALALHRARA
jgi:8-oxo-dGTP diphosphatase